MTYWQWAVLGGLFLLIWVGIAIVGAVNDTKKTLDQTNYQLDLLRQGQLTQSAVLYALEEWKERDEARKKKWAALEADQG